MKKAPPSTPDWDLLYETAAAQAGMFTTRQAADSGYSPQLLVHHTRGGKFTRVQRGIYRVVHFPFQDREELMLAWLWSDRAGVVSHQSALALHALSDVLPAHVHLSLPSAWQRRRVRVPGGVVLHPADVPKSDRTWFGAVPVTTPLRTLTDCARSGLSPELLQQAARQALQRGLVTRQQLREAQRAQARWSKGHEASSLIWLP